MTRARELALTGALLCATAAMLGAWALWAPGVAALLAATLGPAWVALSARHTDVRLGCAASSVQEDERVEVLVRVERSAIPCPGGTLVPWAGAAEVTLKAGRRAELAALAVASRRGRHVVGPARVRIADPFGLCVRERVSGASELMVLPRVHVLPPAALSFLDGAGRSAQDAPQALDSLRTHRPGSPASRIHWPTVARSGVLMERSMTAEEDARVLVELDAAEPDCEEGLDHAVRATASLCVHLAPRGGCLLLLPQDRSASVIGADLKAWPALHARLALITPGGAVRRAPTTGRDVTVFRVTASSGLGTSEIGAHYRVAPAPLHGRATLLDVAGCSVQALERRRRTWAA